MNLEQIFTAKSVASFWNTFQTNNNVAPYLGESIFPSAKKAGLDIKFIKGNTGLPISLMPSAFGAQVTVRNRIGVTALQTEMPFFRDSFVVDEVDRQNILRATDSNDQFAQSTVANIYRDSKNLIDGANVVPERMRMQLLSPEDGSPKISISANGANYEYNFDTDGSFKNNNFIKLSGTSAWTDHEKSDPVKDISDAQDLIFEKTGEKPSILIVSKKTMNDLVKNKTLQSYIVANSAISGGAIRMSSKRVVEFLAEELDITAIVYNKKYEDESGKTNSFFPDDYATLIPSTPLGTTWYGTTPEEADLMQKPDSNVAIVNTGVAVAVITENKVPITTQTIASEVVMPSFEGMNKVFCIKTA